MVIRGHVPLLFRMFQFEIYIMKHFFPFFSYIIFLKVVLNQWVSRVFQMRIVLMFQCSAFFQQGGVSQKIFLLFRLCSKRRQVQKGNHTLFFLRNIGTVYYFLYIYLLLILFTFYYIYLKNQQLTLPSRPYRKTLPHPLFF